LTVTFYLGCHDISTDRWQTQLDHAHASTALTEHTDGTGQNMDLDYEACSPGLRK
jgi:hypothetical protein